MKLPTSTKPTSGFHISDILDLNNKEKQQKKSEINESDEKLSKTDDEICDEIDVELKTENLSCESDENLTETCKRRHNESPSVDSESPRDEKDLKKVKKSSKQDDERKSSTNTSPGHHHQLLSETIHQYPHLFQNHPAMRPWFNSNGELVDCSH